VAFHATVTNTGEQPQQTNAYDALALTCSPDNATSVALGTATLAPGASQTFDVDIQVNRLPETQHCFVGVAFPHQNDAAPRSGLTSDVVDLTVLPAETTTSGP
jgi:hypothetical protein